ncbi:hypothetical protein H2199_000946 [Coniosporium tulheliwenetii]|uniref:Uncharacterized protein n=1 Tax=Coniosporium tulheliwenetii TaxID=3383036 RepID=A0ACC2ZNK1_9PEZI|nr:hypothetical protein H2199_000946 [Cladosporium sp. JES 115]
MPKTIGAWYSGLFDNDRAAARSANEALEKVFASPEKMRNLRKVYQRPILEFCRDIIDKESAETLSDERTTSPDDANAKYSRVVTSSLLAIGSLLANLEAEDIAKQQSYYAELVQDDKLWKLACFDDPAVRRATHRLLKTCISRQREAVESSLDVISSAYLSHALNSDQTGSSYEYSSALVALTKQAPTVWTEHYQGKKPPQQRLKQFLKRGSQIGPDGFWANVLELFASIPKDVLPTQLSESVELLKKDEPRANLGAAWKAYVDVATIIAEPMSDDDQKDLFRQTVLPIIRYYFRPAPDGAQWAIPPAQATKIMGQAVKAGPMPVLLDSEWTKMSELLVEDIRTSLPEQSKDYDKNQTSVEAEGVRWASLQDQALQGDVSEATRSSMLQTNLYVVEEALSVLKTRNGKPYGAAGVVDAIVRAIGRTFVAYPDANEVISFFTINDLPGLFLSPSYKQLASILYSFHDQDWFQEAWQATLKSVLNAPDSAFKESALEELLASKNVPNDLDVAAQNPDLQAFVKRRSEMAIEGAADWKFPLRMLQKSSQVLSADTTDTILASMTRSLSLEDRASNALHGFQQMTKYSSEIIRKLAPTPEGAKLVQSLLYLTESPDDEVAKEASEVNASIQAVLSADTTSASSKQSMFGVIRSGLYEASLTSVSVQTLVDLARKLLQDSPTERAETLQQLLPDAPTWASALAPFLETSPRVSLAITSPLGGALYLVDRNNASPTKGSQIARDAEGYSVALRMAQYVTELLNTADIEVLVPEEKRQEIHYYLSLIAYLGNDNLGLAGANDLWSIYTPEVETEMMSFLFSATSLVSRWLPDISVSVIERFEKAAAGTSSRAYYNALAYSIACTGIVDLQGWQSQRNDGLETTIRSLRRTKDVLFATAFLTGYQTPLSSNKTAVRFCNELVADLTGLDISKSPDEGLRQLVFLNAIIQNVENAAESIAKQRLVFFVKHVIPWLQDDETTDSIQAEVCRALVVLLPLMKDIYGPYWADLLGWCTTVWSEEQLTDKSNTVIEGVIPVIQASLRLFSTLRTLKADEDANDDLVDAWKEAEEGTAKGLVHLLREAQNYPDEFHQPLKIVNELVARQISKIPLEHLKDTGDLFSLLYVASRSVQQTAFEILHKQIPAAQEQVSFDVALEKKSARLPEELMSLILEAPTLDALTDASFERTMPLPLRGYLLSWILVFDHFQNASYKVREDYVENIKDGDYVAGLLDFMSDFLGHAKGKPVDVSKFDITTYRPDEESPEKDTQWLLTHLYYLCLKHLPALTKVWWIDCKSRQKVLAVETWTEKFISLTIITDALKSVSDWAATEEESSEEALKVKVNQRAKEITASYEVDEQTMAIIVRLPGNYPLRQAVVEGLNRVAVDERKWQSWLRNTQGVITFSNNNIVDGLIAWRKNVVGALKGQTECAICYSIISGDKQLPNKRCSTCKNLFHTSCLYKWFKTSNASTCPLCRNTFTYG